MSSRDMVQAQPSVQSGNRIHSLQIKHLHRSREAEFLEIGIRFTGVVQTVSV